MAIILDTNIVSRMRRIERTPLGFRRWAESIGSEHVYLSAITMMEIEAGIVGAERRDPPFANLLRAWRDGLLRNFAGRLLPIDEAIAIRTARLQQIRSVDLPDAFIAATALEHRLTVITHNVRHFEGLGLEVFDPLAA